LFARPKTEYPARGSKLNLDRLRYDQRFSFQVTLEEEAAGIVQCVTCGGQSQYSECGIGLGAP
jgi:hypothetical protein